MINASIENLNAVQRAFNDDLKKINTALSRAVNRATTNVKTNMSKKARERYVIKDADVKSTIKITNATVNRPYAFVKSAGKKIDLTKFRISPEVLIKGEHDYRVQVLKNGGKRPVPGFAVQSNRWGLFRRTGRTRYPITRLMGPSVPEMINRKDAMDYIESEANTMLNKRLVHELERLLGAKTK